MLCQWSSVSAGEVQIATPTATDAFIHSHFIIKEAVLTLYSLWIKEIRTKQATCLLYPRSVFT